MTYRRCAYCIGANGPQLTGYDSLKYAEKDAERLAHAWTTSPCNFIETKWGVAANRNSTLTGLSQFVKQCQSPDLLVVHFSGHAVYDEDLYLLCNETDCDDLITSAIDVNDIKKILSRSSARYKVLILDCCHAGGAYRGAFKGEQDLQDVLNRALQGSANVILCACARYERARELDTLDGGAGFLSWALSAACTTHFRKVSHDGYSLSLRDILHWLPSLFNEINASLSEKERLPLPSMVSETRAGDGEIWFTEPAELTSYRSQLQDKESRLRAMLADHSGFMQDRLNSFVGRQVELAEIRQRIAEKLQTGGYITITGQAGQGKSSIIAKLVEEYGLENVAFHFIPFNPGPDHQVGLLRNLMARLILKYDLPEIYVASESRPALRDYFPKVLKELVAKGGQEVIFLDGLDQIEEEASGIRDLSFLPNNPPPRVVFVLGTRPNDTLRPLELLKPYYEYKLPNLSRGDFDLILQHRLVQLDKGLVDQFYHVVQENALYLDLVAKELMESGAATPTEIIKRINHNPDNLFSLSMARLKRQPIEWREVIKPLLGLLLVTREPLALQYIRQILGVEDDRLREGIARLGGLLTDDGRRRYSLFHRKLHDYLRQDTNNPYKEYIFAIDEEEGWHKTLAVWCEQEGISGIWEEAKYDLIEQGRREYARRHYITHLYYARDWSRLFAVLDEGTYGRAKLRYDPSTRQYAQDLDLGRQAASWKGWTLKDGLERLPHLWRYTLLQCSLASRANKYPLAAFRLLVMFRRELEAIGLAELVSASAYRVEALIEIAKQIGEQSGREQDRVQVLRRACEVADVIEEPMTKAEALWKLGEAFAQVQRWEYAQQTLEEAEAVILTLQEAGSKVRALSVLGEVLARVQQWSWAEKVLGKAEVVNLTLTDRSERVEGLSLLARALVRARQWERAKQMWAEAETMIDDTLRGWGLWKLDQLSEAFAQTQQWELAESVMRIIPENSTRAKVLGILGAALAQAHHWERAEAVWDEAEILIRTIAERSSRGVALIELGRTLAQAQQQERAKQVWLEAQAIFNTIKERVESEWLAEELVQVLAQAQHWKQAEAVIHILKEQDDIIDPLCEARALSALSEALAKAQQWEWATKVWAEAEAMIHAQSYDFYGSSGPLRNLAAALAQAQHWELARAVICAIELSWERAKALSALAAALAQEQQWERAEAVWTEAEAVIHTIQERNVEIGGGFTDWVLEALCEQSKSFAQTRQWERALAVIRTIRSIEQFSDIHVSSALCELSKALAQAQYWEQAEAVTRSIAISWERAKALSMLGAALAQAQHWEQAEAVWNEAEILIQNGLRDYDYKATGELSKALAQAQYWERAEAVTRSIAISRERAKALSMLGAALAQAQHWEQAEAVWNEAEILIQNGQPYYDHKAAALCSLAEALAIVGKYERLLHLTQCSWIQASTKDYAIMLLSMATGLIPLKPELGTALCRAFEWVDAFLKG